MTSLEPEFVLARLAMLGIDVELDGDRVRLSGASASLPSDLRTAFQESREGLVALLRSQGGSMRPAEGPAKPRPDVLCLSCYGTTFVRLRNGRRSVCPECERVQPSEIAGIDSGFLGAPLERDGGGA